MTDVCVFGCGMTLAFLLFSLWSLSLPPPPQTQHISPPLARLRSASEFCLRVRQRRLTEAEGRDQPPIEPASPLLIYCHANNEDLGACSQKYKLCVCVCEGVCVCVYIYIYYLYIPKYNTYANSEDLGACSQKYKFMCMYI
jgi:hypothetical protein